MPSLENQQADYTPEAPKHNTAELSREVMSFAPTMRQDNDFQKTSGIGTDKNDKLSSTTDSSMQLSPIWQSVWKGNNSEQDQLDQGRMKNPYQNLFAQQLEAQFSPHKSLDQNLRISAPGMARDGQTRDGQLVRAEMEAGARPDLSGQRPDLSSTRPEARGLRPDAAQRPDAQRPDALAQRPGAPREPQVDQTPEGDRNRTAPRTEHGNRLVARSEGMMDQQVWRGTKHERSVNQGRLGGAASVSRILQGEGYNYADSSNVGKLTDQLSHNGWQLVGRSQMQPGDVIFGGRPGTNWKAGGGNARVGIVGANGMIHHNNPETGKWTKSTPEEAFQKGQFGDQVWALRPPEGGPGAERQQSGPEGQRMRGRREQSRDFQPSEEGRRPRQEEGEQGERQHRRHRGRERSEQGDRADRRRGRESDRTNPDSEDRQSNNDRTRRENSGPMGDQNARNLRSAKGHVGDQMWRNGYGLGNGRLGCAASVSEVLKDAGVRGVHSAGVAQAAEQLTRQGWTQHSGLDKAEPGDVVVVARRSGWRNGGGGAHIGIVGENGKVYHNRSSTGRWTEDNLGRVFGGGMSRFILKPPRGR